MADPLQTALRNGRVTAATAPERSIRKLVRTKHLAPTELAGVYILTELGRCAAGDCSF